MVNVGWWKRRRSLAPSILHVKGDLEILFSAWFITSFPAPLRSGLLYFHRWWRFSLQEKNSLGGVLDLRLWLASFSSLEEPSKLEGDRFRCTRRSFFLSHRSPFAWLYYRLAFRIRDFPLESGFYSYGWYAHYPLDIFLDLVHV